MRNSGLQNFAEEARQGTPAASAKRIGLCLSLIGLLMLGACATGGDVATSPQDGEAPPVQKSQAHHNLRTSTEKLSEPLDATEEEAKVLGGFLGTGISVGLGSFGVGGGKKKSARVALPLGVIAGSLAGSYVSAKQKEYSEEVEVVEAITKDVREKNQHAERTIQAMEVVVAEDRARLAELREAEAQGQVSESVLEQQVALAEDDLETMKQAVSNSEEHLSIFTDARTIVLKESQDPDLPSRPEMNAMDGEIEVLRERIRAMQGLVDELSSVS